MLIALALVAPLARAGDEANPEVSDSVDARITDGSLDFLSAWFEPHPTGLAFTIKVREAGDLKPDHGWGVGFDMGGQRHLPFLAIDSKGKLRSCACLAGQGKIGPADAFPDDLQDVTFHPGKPAYFSGLVPYSAVPGLGPGAVLENVGAASLTRGTGGWSDFDGNSALDGYAVQRAFLPPAAAHALPYVAGGLLLVAAGAGGAWLVLRRRAAQAPPEDQAQPDASPPRALDASPAGRMSLKPPPP
jgi:hypothetical protein